MFDDDGSAAAGGSSSEQLLAVLLESAGPTPDGAWSEGEGGCVIDPVHPSRRTGRRFSYTGRRHGSARPGRGAADRTAEPGGADAAADQATGRADRAPSPPLDAGGEPSAAGGEPSAAGAPGGAEPGTTGDGAAGSPLAVLLERGADALDEARVAHVELSRQAAARARALHAFARQRPAGAFDRAPGEVGALSAAARAARPAALTEVSEWAVHEVAVALRISRAAATALLEQAVVLVERLPGTLEVLGRGGLTPAHAAVMGEVVGEVDDPGLRAQAEARLLARLGAKTPPELKAAARRTVALLDAEAAARRMVRALRARRVSLHEGADGMAELTAVLAGPVGQACLRTLEALAEATGGPGDERTRAQRMADCLADLILRPGHGDLPAVQIALTVVASAETLRGGGEPGEVDGVLVPAEMVRELAYSLALLPRPATSVGEDGEPDERPAGDEPGAPVSGTQPATAPERHGAAPGATARAATEPGTVAAAAVEASAGEATTDEAATTEPGAVEANADEPAAIAPEETGTPDTPAATATGGGQTGAEPCSADGEPDPDGSFAAALERRRADLDTCQQQARSQAAAGAAAAACAGRWTDGEQRDLLDLAALLTVRDTAGTALAHRPHIAVVDKLRGTLVALTDAAGLCRLQALGPPPGSDDYEPPAALARFVRLRDRRCRFPGCRARPRRCDLDHQRPWPHGPTAHTNLCCLCETHHRLKHQAPGWQIAPADDDGLAVRTPSGDVIVTHPPRYGADDDLPPF